MNKKEKLKRILIVDNSVYVTGCINSILQTSSMLNERYEFIYLLPKKSTVFTLVNSYGFKTLALPMQELNKSAKVITYLPVLLLNAFKLLRIIHKYEIDIIHINDVYNMLGVLVKLLKPKTKVVYYVRLLRSSYLGIAYPVFAFLVRNFSNSIICVSNAVFNDINRPDNGTVLYTNSVSEQLAAWNGLRVPQEAKILYIGNYIEGKGHKWAIMAMKEVNAHFPKAQLRFVGGVNSNYDEANKILLKNMAAEMQLENNICFDGPTHNSEHEMKQADIVLNLSESESFSMVCLEAISFGVPLVTSDSGGPAEITDSGQFGKLVPNKNPKAAAIAISQIIQYPDAAIECARKARIFAATRFNKQSAIEGLVNIYQ